MSYVHIKIIEDLVVDAIRRDALSEASQAMTVLVQLRARQLKRIPLPAMLHLSRHHHTKIRMLLQAIHQAGAQKRESLVLQLVAACLEAGDVDAAMEHLTSRVHLKSFKHSVLIVGMLSLLHLSQWIQAQSMDAKKQAQSYCEDMLSRYRQVPDTDTDRPWLGDVVQAIQTLLQVTCPDARHDG